MPAFSPVAGWRLRLWQVLTNISRRRDHDLGLEGGRDHDLGLGGRDRELLPALDTATIADHLAGLVGAVLVVAASLDSVRTVWLLLDPELLPGTR